MKSCLFIIFIVILISCKRGKTNFETWTTDIKQKIINASKQPFDRVTFDSTYFNQTYYKGNRKLKYFAFRPHYDSVGHINFMDTLVSIFYSADQKFKLVRELCPASERSFEVIDYKNIGHVGLVEFKFCNGKIKERGFRYGNKDIGIWEEYDSSGRIVSQKNNGNLDLLNNLKNIKYKD